MARRRISSIRVRRDSQGFTAGLSSAIFEWLLIFLLFVDALFSYLLTKLARFCELQTPCLFCSRLDHVFSNQKPGFYWDLVCGAHKLEISSLVFCQIHEKLADVHGMCEGCLSSFVKEKKAKSETYRLLVAKLGKNHECCVHKNPLKHLKLGASREKHCSCCEEPWKLRSYYTHRFLPTKSIGPKVAELNISLPGPLRRSRPALYDGLSKRRAKTSGLLQSTHLGSRGFDSLSHIGYTELKITSDSESEIQYSDDGDASGQVREMEDLREHFVPHHVQQESRNNAPNMLHKALSDILSMHKTSDQSSLPRSLLSVPERKLDVSESHNVTSSLSAVDDRHGLEELKWQQVEQTPEPALSELISLDDIPSSSNTMEERVNVSGETFDVIGIGDLVQASVGESAGLQKPESALATRKMSGFKSDEVVELPGETLDIQESGDIGQKSITESGEVSRSESGLPHITGSPCLKTDQVSNDSHPPVPQILDLSNAYGQDVGNKGGQTSRILTEQLTLQGSAKINEDLKLLLSQISPARGLELLVNDRSPRVRGFADELRSSDVSSSIGSHTLQIRPSIERNEFGFDSLDESIVGEIEGESVLDRLKRQIEYDRKSMSALYKELEEERNASAVAANQAMAMITRLQEEKASLHMEALQYLRMMEEQAEYDVEALQKANDLLADKEKEIQDLEAELDLYRNKLSEDAIVENMHESYELAVEDMRVESSDLSFIGNNTNGPCTPRSLQKYEHINKTEKTDAVHGNMNVSFIDGSLIDFEDERLYISECLKNWEKKFNSCFDNGVHPEMVNGGNSGKEAYGLNDVRNLHSKEVIQENNYMEQNMPSVQNDSSPSGEGLLGEERSTPLVGDSQIVYKESHHFDGPNSKIINRETNLVSLENEVLDLNDRLEALEADRNFLKHTVNSLQSGSEGLKYIQEIALLLRELRNIGTQRREKDAV